MYSGFMKVAFLSCGDLKVAFLNPRFMKVAFLNFPAASPADRWAARGQGAV
jgi:hypothetical protein